MRSRRAQIALEVSVSQVYTGGLKNLSSFEGARSNRATSTSHVDSKHKGFIAQLGVRTTEDREVLGSIPSGAKRHRDRVVKVIHSRWIGRETAQVQILSVLVSADIKRIGRMVKWKSLLTSNQLFRVRSPVWLPGPVI